MTETVTLSKGYAGAGGGFSELKFRPPRWADFIALGDIEEWQPVGDDEAGKPRFMLIRHHDVVAQYAERLVEAPRTAGDLEILELADAIAVHDRIRDFFAKARASSKRPTDSSGDTAKASTTSGD